MSDPATQLLTVEETAARLKIGRSRAYELVSSQSLPGSMRIGRSLRVSARHLEEWIDKQAREPDPSR